MEEHLAGCVRSGALGRDLLGKAYADVAGSKAGELVKGAVAELRGSKITQAPIEAARVKLVATGKELGRDMDDSYTTVTHIMAPFLGAAVNAEVVSIHDEFLALLWVHTKTVEISKQLLPASSPSSHCRRDASRRRCRPGDSQGLRRRQVSSGAAPRRRDLHQRHHGRGCLTRSFLLGMDRRFRLGQAFFLHMVDEGAAVKCKRPVIEQLPDTAKDISVHVSLQKLSLLAKGELYDFVDIGLQAAFHRVFEEVKAIAGDRALRADPLAEPFLINCHSLVANWCDMAVPGAAPPPPPRDSSRGRGEGASGLPEVQGDPRRQRQRRGR